MNTNNWNMDRAVIRFSYAICGTILFFLCAVHLFVLLGFFFNIEVSKYYVPAALVGTLGFGYFFAQWQGLVGRAIYLPCTIFLVLLVFSIGISVAFYDMSWDGLWYHQTAVYKMADGWNPVRQPMIENVAHHAKLWVTHYAKGSWYDAVGMYKATGNIESGKFSTWMAMFAAFLAIFACGLELGLNRKRAITLGILVSLNPVVICQLLSTYVDGLAVSYMACFAAIWIGWMRNPKFSTVAIGMMAAILAINAKFTGLIYLCFIILAGGIYCLIFKRKAVFQYAGIQIAALILGVVVFGYNPYITNTIHRGNPFYPVLGSKEHPSLVSQGNDLIEKHETPYNMRGRNRIVRFGYALFGRPVYDPVEKADLTFPFVYNAQDFGRYYFHEQRIAGFGPYFGGVFVLSLPVLAILLLRNDVGRGKIVLCILILAISLLISKDTWWARYGPQMWWIPFVPIAVVFLKMQEGKLLKFAWVMCIILFINILIVAAGHISWEYKTTNTLKNQIAQMQDDRVYEIDFKWFEETFGRRLSKEGVTFIRSKFDDNAKDIKEIISVCPGYPGTVQYKPIETDNSNDN